MKPSSFFSEQEQQVIVTAIKEAELNTSGEIRVHIEGKCKYDVLDRAAYIFEKLGMHQTKLRNGVLFYLAVEDRKFAILGDAGINKVVPSNFWDETKSVMEAYFNRKEFAAGLAKGIQMAGIHLKKYFAYQQDDVNELSDDISFGKK